MKKIRSLFVAFLLVFTCLSLPATVNADSSPTVSEKANVLNKLAILNGDASGNYMLGSPLIRSQAAAFIVNFLGKKSYVGQNSGTLSKTVFADVPSTQWYAPYVGYCNQQGIIVGVSSNTFKPDDPISEKSFLKIVLVALDTITEPILRGAMFTVRHTLRVS